MSTNEMPDLKAIRRQMDEEARIAEANGETPIVGGMDWAKNLEDTTDNTPENVRVEEIPQPPTAPVEEYNGPGMVIEKREEEPPKEYTGISPTTQGYIDAYLADMDRVIEEQQEAEANAPVETEEINDEDDSDASYEEAVVMIDKLGVGRVLDFTPEEHAKLTKAKTIKLNEVETVAIETYNRKRVKDPKNAKSIIKSVNTLHTTPICLPISGYTANIRGCTAYELMSLLDGGSNVVLDAQTKWSLIHSKIESTSIGNMDFNEFLMNTAAADYNNFIYGILCATYPEAETTTLKCTDCKTTYEYPYSVRGLIRPERMSDRLRDQFKNIIDASVTVEDAVRVHDNSPIKFLKAVRLPISGIIVEIQVQSAYDYINNSIKALTTDEKDPNAKYNTAMVIATLVKRVLIEDPEDPDSMYEFTSSKDIAEIIYELRERDILIIRSFGDELMGDMTIEYGFKDVSCPKCGKSIDYIPVDPEKLLFQRYRQELSASIE